MLDVFKNLGSIFHHRMCDFAQVSFYTYTSPDHFAEVFPSRGPKAFAQ